MTVPNVEPFELASVKDIQPGSETASQAANELEDQPETTAPTPGESGATRNVSVKVDTKTNMLGVFEAEKLIAAYPITVGSARTTSPIGDWKVRGIAKVAQVSLRQGDARAWPTQRQFLHAPTRATKSGRRDVDCA